MTQTNSEIKNLAQRGNAKAIVTLINRTLQPQGITIAKANVRDGCLRIMFEAAQVPNKKKLVAFVNEAMKRLHPKVIERVKLYGRQKGEKSPAWSVNLELVGQISSPNQEQSQETNSAALNQVFQSPHNEDKKTKKQINVSADDYRVPLEKEILYASLSILAFVFLFFFSVSLGSIIFVLAISAFWFKIRQAQLLGKGVKISENQLPKVYQSAKVASEHLSMKIPNIFVKEERAINAYATGFLEEKKTVVLNSALVEAMDTDEITFILGHEFSHIKCDHTNWIVLTNTSENIARIPIISDITGFIFLLWSRKCEYTCDRAGLLASRNLKASVSALAKLSIGGQLFKELNLDALLQQKSDIDASDFSKMSELFETHPHVINRIHELQKFYNSNIYKKLTQQ